MKINSIPTIGAFLVSLLMFHISVGAAVAQGKPERNYIEATFGSAKTVSLHYGGTAKVHARLGFRITMESRVGKLTVDLKFVREGSSYSRTEVFRLNGESLKDNMIQGGADPGALRNGDVSEAKSLVYLADLIASFSMDRAFSITIRRSSLSYEFSITPHATELTYRGRRISAALFQSKVYVRPSTDATKVEQAYVSDEVPGRILRMISQDYSDNGTPSGRTELSLVSADLK